MHALLGRWGRLVAVAAIVVGSGCGSSGDGLPREAVSGSVSLDGKPLESGRIEFLPMDPSGAAVSGGATIEKGVYAINAGVGLTPGQYRVSISSASSGMDASGAPGSAAALAKEAIPAKYNQDSTLTADVKAGGDNTFPFELTSK